MALQKDQGRNRPEPIKQLLSDKSEPMRRDLARALDSLYGLHFRPGHLDTLLEIIQLHAPVKILVAQEDQGRLAEIAARERKATKGEWVYERLSICARVMQGGETESHDVVDADVAGTDDKFCRRVCGLACTRGKYEREEANGLFIAHAKSDIPWLLAAVTRLREENARLKVYEDAEPGTTEIVREAHAESEQLREENARLKAELRAVDEALARRPALSDLETRYAKVERACATASRADRLAGELESLKARASS